MRLARVGCQRCFIRGGVNSTTAPRHRSWAGATAAAHWRHPHPRFPFLEAEDKKNVLLVCWRCTAGTCSGLHDWCGCRTRARVSWPLLLWSHRVSTLHKAIHPASCPGQCWCRGTTSPQYVHVTVRWFACFIRRGAACPGPCEHSCVSVGVLVTASGQQRHITNSEVPGLTSLSCRPRWRGAPHTYPIPLL